MVTHVIGGFSSLLFGIIIMLLPKKGNLLHKQMGRVYFYGMSTVFVTAVLFVSLVRWNTFLFAIAVFSFYLCYSGFRAIRSKKATKIAPIDWVSAVLAICVGLGLFIYGVLIFNKLHTFHILAFLCVVFGFFTVFAAVQDLRTKMNVNKSKDWWIRQHISGMLGSLIAATTAFSVQNLNFLIPGESMDWLLWLLPTVIGAPLINQQIAKLKKPKTQRVAS